MIDEAEARLSNAMFLGEMSDGVCERVSGGSLWLGEWSCAKHESALVDDQQRL
jgi:hypothetical protein